jgi:vacuolar-type H+-ATPase subunit I/STV1
MKLLSVKSLFILFFISIFFVPKVFSQNLPTPTASPENDFTAQQAYKDYVYTFDLYKKAHSDYLLSVSQYKQAQTLASKTKAQEATAKMLEARDDVVVTYLTALRLRLSEAQGVDTVDRDGLYSRLDSEIAWFNDHRQTIASAGSLSDLTEDSNAARDRFLTVEPLSYEVLSVIPLGKVEIVKSKTNAILSEIKIKTEEIRAKGDHDTTITERWIIETENKIARGLDKQIEAQRLITNFQTPAGSRKKPNYEENYNQIIDLLTQSNQDYKESSSYLKEIIRSLKVSQ